MKNFISILSLISASLLMREPVAAQKSTTDPELLAEVRIVFVDGPVKDEYGVPMKIVQGKLKTGQAVDALGSKGERYSFTVREIHGDDGVVTEIGENDNVYVTLKVEPGVTPKGFDTGFKIVKKGGQLPGAAATTPATAEPAPKTTEAETNFTLKDKKWTGSGYSNSHLFYAKGISNLHDGKPFLILAFKATTSPDDRQLTLMIYNFAGKTDKYQKADIEVLLSGSESGDPKKSELIGCKSPYSETDFMIEITDYRLVNANEAEVSGKYSGTLKQTFGLGKEKIENGTFSKVKVKVYPDRY
jgi:hypothetical protein